MQFKDCKIGIKVYDRERLGEIVRIKDGVVTIAAINFQGRTLGTDYDNLLLRKFPDKGNGTFWDISYYTWHPVISKKVTLKDLVDKRNEI